MLLFTGLLLTRRSWRSLKVCGVLPPSLRSTRRRVPCHRAWPCVLARSQVCTRYPHTRSQATAKLILSQQGAMLLLRTGWGILHGLGHSAWAE